MIMPKRQTLFTAAIVMLYLATAAVRAEEAGISADANAAVDIAAATGASTAASCVNGSGEAAESCVNPEEEVVKPEINMANFSQSSNAEEQDEQFDNEEDIEEEDVNYDDNYDDNYNYENDDEEDDAMDGYNDKYYEEEEQEDFVDEEDQEEEEFEEPGSEFGITQIIYDEEVDEQAILRRLETTNSYMVNEVWESEYFWKFPKLCWNRRNMCTVWAAEGECESNEEFMMEMCAPACFACKEVEEGKPGIEFGAAQIIKHENITEQLILDKLEETKRYLDEVVMADDFYVKVRDLCYNLHELCSIWAVDGLCQDEDENEYMYEQCAPSCGVCEHLHYETRCPIDPILFPSIWQPGDVNKMFYKLTNDKEYNITAWSRPEYLPGDNEETADYMIGPWIVTIDDFITPEEAAVLIEQGQGRYERSTEVGDVDEETGESMEGIVSEDRTSTNAWCVDNCGTDPVVVDIYKRIEKVTGVPTENSESFQLLKYERDGFYLTHHDYIPNSHKKPGGPRILTVYMYLSDVEEGGETRFDWFDMVVKPKLGRVAIWPSVLDEDPMLKDGRTMHEAMPVIKGQKFGANAWLHLRNYTKAQEMDC